MEHNGSNQNLSAGSHCRAGCGFYGNAAFEGMCSKCYKDVVKRRQQNPTPTSQVGASGRISPPTSHITTSIATSIATSVDVSTPSVESSVASMSTMTMGTSTLSIASRTTPSVETAMPTVPSSADKAESNEKSESESVGAEAAGGGKDKDGASVKKPKKNRCNSCKKKLGLTVFECRCGGLYCSIHRYSDKHECTFNYKEMAQEQIRKNNPVVVGEKIQKI